MRSENFARPRPQVPVRLRVVYFVQIIFAYLLISPTFSTGQTYQVLTIDPFLSANSEQMGFGNNGKSEGLRKVIMGPYSVSHIDKMDTGSFRTKVKEGKEMSWGSEAGFEEFKIKRIEEKNYYILNIGRDTDSAVSFFSVFSSVRKSSETVLSAILSKKQETSSTEYFDDSRLLLGVIDIKADSVRWNFLLNFPPSRVSKLNNELNGYLTNGIDTMMLGIVYADVVKKSKKEEGRETIMMRTPRGYSLINKDNRQAAVIVFKQSSIYLAKKGENFTGGEIMMIGNENSPSAHMAIATLFSIILGIQ